MKQLYTIRYSGLLLVLFSIASTNGFLESYRKTVTERNTDVRKIDRNFFGNTWQRSSDMQEERRNVRFNRDNSIPIKNDRENVRFDRVQDSNRQIRDRRTAEMQRLLVADRRAVRQDERLRQLSDRRIGDFRSSTRNSVEQQRLNTNRTPERRSALLRRQLLTERRSSIQERVNDSSKRVYRQVERRVFESVPREQNRQSESRQKNNISNSLTDQVRALEHRDQNRQTRFEVRQQRSNQIRENDIKTRLVRDSQENVRKSRLQNKIRNSDRSRQVEDRQTNERKMTTRQVRDTRRDLSSRHFSSPREIDQNRRIRLRQTRDANDRESTIRSIDRRDHRSLTSRRITEPAKRETNQRERVAITNPEFRHLSRDSSQRTQERRLNNRLLLEKRETVTPPQKRQVSRNLDDDRRRSDTTRRISEFSKNANNNERFARQSHVAERRLATSFTDVSYIPMKTNMLLNAVQVVLFTFLVAQVFSNSSKTKNKWLHHLNNIVIGAKQKVL